MASKSVKYFHGNMRGAPARTAKPKFRIEAANQLIADVPPVRDPIQLQQLAVARIGKEVVNIEEASVSFPDPNGGTLAIPGRNAVVRDNPVVKGQVDVLGKPPDDPIGLRQRRAALEHRMFAERRSVKRGERPHHPHILFKEVRRSSRLIGRDA